MKHAVIITAGRDGRPLEAPVVYGSFRELETAERIARTARHAGVTAQACPINSGRQFTSANPTIPLEER